MIQELKNSKPIPGIEVINDNEKHNWKPGSLLFRISLWHQKRKNKYTENICNASEIY